MMEEPTAISLHGGRWRNLLPSVFTVEDGGTYCHQGWNINPDQHLNPEELLTFEGDCLSWI
jgi:hypothetical protein